MPPGSQAEKRGSVIIYLFCLMYSRIRFSLATSFMYEGRVPHPLFITIIIIINKE